MIGTQFVVVNASNSVRIWKNLHGGVFITEESASAQEENIRAGHSNECPEQKKDLRKV